MEPAAEAPAYPEQAVGEVLPAVVGEEGAPTGIHRKSMMNPLTRCRRFRPLVYEPPSARTLTSRPGRARAPFSWSTGVRMQNNHPLPLPSEPFRSKMNPRPKWASARFRNSSVPPSLGHGNMMSPNTVGS